jgi:hypothetical protein
MARKIFFIILFGIVSALVVTFFPEIDKVQASINPVDEGARQQILDATLAVGGRRSAVYSVDDNARQRILDATVRITVYAEEASTSLSATQTENEYALGDGLGTLVQDGPNTYIVTHDHWSRLVDNLYKVQFRNAGGDLLLELDRPLFYSLIRYRDGGLMVLVAPEEIASQMTAVPVNKGAELSVDQPLLMAFWQPEADQQISVEPVTVEIIETYEGQTAIRMRSLNSRIVVQGNSGGGVFSSGQLVGTMWETIVQKHLVNGQATAETSSTDISRAALVEYEIGISDDLSPAAVEHSLLGGEF